VTAAPKLEDLLQDEIDCTMDAFSRDMAWSLGMRIRELLLERRSSAAVEVVHCGVVAFYSSLTGATVDLEHWIRRKRNVVNRFGHSSLWVKVSAQTFPERFRLPDSDHAAVGGSFPILVAGTGQVGTVSISGMGPDVDEHALIVRCLREMRSPVTAVPMNLHDR
jgi:uncharacterized protein (UPF0303 family)